MPLARLPSMGPAELVLLFAVVLAPLILGAALGYTNRPWWWGAVAAVVLFLIAAITPEPEAGEPRVAAGDLGFLAVVALVVIGLTWLGSFLGRRIAGRNTRG